MRLIFVLLLISFLFSCANTEKRTVVLKKETEKDIFESETLLRKDIEVIKKKFKTASSYCYRGKIEKGLGILKKNFKKFGKTSSYWNSIGNCYLLKKDYKKARFYYKIGLSYNSNDYEILNNIAYIHIKKDQHYKAYEILKKIAPKANLRVAKYNLASLHFYFSKYDKSIQELRGLYQLNPKDPDLNLLLAKNYVYQGDYASAQAHFNKLPERFLRENEVSNFKSYTLVKLGKFEEAKDVLRRQRKPSTRDYALFKNNLSSLINRKIIEKAASEAR